MRKLVSLITLLSFSLHAAVITDDKVIVGKKSSASAKEIVFDTNDGTANKKLSVDKITKKLSATSDEVIVGDGTATDKALTFNRGGSNAQLKWNETTDKLEFSNDGSTYKAIGSGSGTGGSGGVNLLSNDSFEDAVGGSITDWSNTGGTFSQQTFTNGSEGNLKYARFIASGSGQYFESTAKAITSDTAGGCQADFKKYNTATESAFKIEAMDTTGATIYASQTLSAGSWIKAPTISFQCPAAATLVKIRVTSLSAATIEVDRGYIGSNQNLVNTIASNDTDWAACTFSTLAFQGLGTITNNSLQCKRKGGDLLMRGKFTPGTLTGSEARFLLPSNFGAITTSAAIATNEISNTIFRNSDGGNYIFTTIIQPSVNYFNLSKVLTSGTTSAQVPETGSSFGAGLYDLVNLSIPINGWTEVRQQDVAVSNEQMNWYVDASIGGANVTATTASSYTELTNSSLDMVLNSGSATAEIPCSGTNPSTGLTCAAGSEGLGIVFTPPMAGRYEVCAYFSSDAAGGGTVETQLIETPNNAQTLLQEGNTRMGHSNAISMASSCAYFNFASTAKRTVRLMFEKDAGTYQVYADRSATVGQRDVHFTVTNVTFAQNRPILAEQKENEIVLVASNGYGSSATTTYRWTNIIKNLGTALTLTQSSSLGDTITINEKGIYCTTFSVGNTSVNFMGVTINSNGASSTDAIASLNLDNFLAVGLSGSSVGGSGGCKWLNKNDVLRVQTEGTATAVANRARWTVTKMTP